MALRMAQRLDRLNFFRNRDAVLLHKPFTADADPLLIQHHFNAKTNLIAGFINHGQG